jgi:hypothetical protein
MERYEMPAWHAESVEDRHQKMFKRIYGQIVIANGGVERVLESSVVVRDEYYVLKVKGFDEDTFLASRLVDLIMRNDYRHVSSIYADCFEKNLCIVVHKEPIEPARQQQQQGGPPAMMPPPATAADTTLYRPVPLHGGLYAVDAAMPSSSSETGGGGGSWLSSIGSVFKKIIPAQGRVTQQEIDAAVPIMPPSLPVVAAVAAPGPLKEERDPEQMRRLCIRGSQIANHELLDKNFPELREPVINMLHALQLRDFANCHSVAVSVVPAVSDMIHMTVAGFVNKIDLASANRCRETQGCAVKEVRCCLAEPSITIGIANPRMESASQQASASASAGRKRKLDEAPAAVVDIRAPTPLPSVSMDRAGSSSSSSSGSNKRARIDPTRAPTPAIPITNTASVAIRAPSRLDAVAISLEARGATPLPQGPDVPAWQQQQQRPPSAFK